MHRMLWSILVISSVASAEPPAGFVFELIGDNWDTPVGVLDRFDNHLVVWEREGKLWIVEPDGTRQSSPWLDIAEEVGGWRDHGLLGVALHPNFENNGWVYLLYVVDRHHLLNFGTDKYSSSTDEYFQATIGRITRFTANVADGFMSIDPASRLVLLGETPQTGLPILYQSHSVGSLHFGDDGTLLASMGDSGNYGGVDTGGDFSGSYVINALDEGMLGEHENVGGYRSQTIDSLCGKILRLDAATGDGVASNPFFDATAPRSARSRVWTLGLRNPFRWSHADGTGSHDPNDANPGWLLVGDVGWYITEELSLVDQGGLNLGWPIFEGMTTAPGYPEASPEHPTAPNPLADGETCAANFNFRDLLRQDTPQDGVQFYNPCAVLEAEDAEYDGPQFRNGVYGFLGTGYVDFQHPKDDWLRWSFHLPTAGEYELIFRYAIGAGEDRPLRLERDGIVIDAEMPFPSTGSFREWRTTRKTVVFEAGAHTISLHAIGSSGANFDCLLVLPAGSEDQATVPSTTPTFAQHRPLIDWKHGEIYARVPYFQEGAALFYELGTADSEVPGDAFPGNCAIGGPLMGLGKTSWPKSWRGAFFGDYVFGWIRCAPLDGSGVVQSVSLFDTGFAGMSFLGASRSGDELYVTTINGVVGRYRWAPDGNQTPVARVVSSTPFGPAPHSVDFDATSSSDPDGDQLTYTWDFDDGSPVENGAIVAHVFSVVDSTPQRFDVTMTAQDPDGAMDQTTIVVSVNNTPPSVEILSPLDGSLYSMEYDTTIALTAQITDAEHDRGEITCAWHFITHHNSHEHPEPADEACETTAVVSPLGCGEENYWYECELTVTDAHGLSTTVSSSIYPDCDGTLACVADLNHDAVVDGADLTLLLGNWGALGGDIDGDGTTDGTDLAKLLGGWGDC